VGAPFQGWCPASAVDDGGCPGKPDHLTLDVRLEADTVWLSQAQMAELFGRERTIISKHIGTVFKVGELAQNQPVSNLNRVQIVAITHPGFLP